MSDDGEALKNRRGDAFKGRITVKDIARELGVSIATVSRAISNDPTIAKLTRERVLAKTAEMGYEPNLFARGLITNKSKIAALFVTNLANPFYPEVVVRLSRRLQEVGLQTMLFTSDGKGGVDDTLPLLQQYCPDVAIVLAANVSSKVVKANAAKQTPLILFNRYVVGANISAVCCDNASGGRMVAQKLAQAGHRRLAYISGLNSASTNIDRLRGYREGCAEAGLDAPKIIQGGSFTYEAGYRAMIQLFEKPYRPEAVFCANDIVAIGAMDAARQNLGLSIPDDVSIIGFDDISICSWPSYELTTVRQPMDTMIELVISEIEDLLSTDNKPNQYFVPGELIVRKSARLI